MILVFVMLMLLLAAYIYIKKPTLIDTITTAPGNHPESTSTPSGAVSTSDGSIKLGAFNPPDFWHYKGE